MLGLLRVNKRKRVIKMILYDKLSNTDKAKLIAFKEKYYQRYVSYLQEELDNKLLKGFTNNNDTINQYIVIYKFSLIDLTIT